MEPCCATVLYTGMMRKFVRALLIWLAVLAIPVQGFASATMLLCGPGHHAVSAATDSSMSSSHAQHHDAQVAQAEQHCHDEVADMPSHDEGPSLKQLKLFKAKCSACAYCCMAAFMPSSEVTVTVTHLPSSPIAYFQVPFVGFAPDTFERPPRA